MKKVVCLLAAAMLCLGLTACNTVKGVGQDVSAVGGDIDSAATAVQNKM
ncbi:entericidin A/B family lipoprotein [Turicimonas muris]|uniref:Entericidin n=1 Tax=Turicimonas muris TaxID=1796652 RepID=A0A227KPN2_9BURK|nr:entericidin A/B family lipoprotein [Turicimonas muris]ARE60878.1 entericidin [Burkholderiales bacterium YL45]OXE50113.1 entericidin [Turicimonas muris]QQQ95718.1 entericidin A/B family lipoprotein [Turicimonas muris]